MQDFRTILKPIKGDVNIDHKSNIGLIGSCFSEHIGQLLSDFQFNTWINPRGILFNPWSIADLLEGIESEDSDIGLQDGLWYSLYHHGSFSSTDKSEFLLRLKDESARTIKKLSKTNILILTFGTANVFRFKNNGKIVANCHKLPNNQFDRIRLTIEQIHDRLTPVLNNLLSTNPSLKIILTVSPVRHVRDGLVENQKSKATLLLAVEKLMKSNSNIRYFPSYELLMDDLRDYRFYAPDMIHPSETAVKYVWDFFKTTYFNNETNTLLSTIKKLKQQLHHKPIHPDSKKHREFQEKLKKDIRIFEEKYPYVQLK